MRLFLAINFPDEVRRDLWNTIAPLRETDFPIRWVRPEGIHLTLKFLGPVADEREDEMQRALGRAVQGIRPIAVQVTGFGAFPDLRAPRVLWAGLQADPALELLQHHVEREFAPLGFPPEGRPFHPHVTLGRSTRDARARDFQGLDGALAGLDFTASVLISSAEIMESTLQRSGAVYHVRHSERLS